MDAAKRCLRQILGRYGHALCDDPRRLRSLLRDVCGQYKREVNVLLAGLEEGVAASLQQVPASQRAMLLPSLQRRLQDHRGIGADLAKWCVQAWAEGLGGSDAAGARLLVRCPSCSSDIETRGEHIGFTVCCVHCQTRLQIIAEGAEAVLCPDAAAGPGPSNVTVVAADGTGTFRSIAAAIADSPPGARILVQPGCYNEPLVLRQAVELVAAGPAEGAAVQTSGIACVAVRGGDVLLRGLRLSVIAGPGHRSPAVDLSAGRLVMENCRVNSVGAEGLNAHGTGVEADLRASIITSERSNGLVVWNGATCRVSGCELLKNASTGVRVERATLSLHSSRVTGGRYHGVEAKQSNLDIVESEICGNADTGVSIAGGEFTIARTRITDNGGRGIWAYARAKGLVEDCDLRNNRRGHLHAAEADVVAVGNRS